MAPQTRWLIPAGILCAALLVLAVARLPQPARELRAEFQDTWTDFENVVDQAGGVVLEMERIEASLSVGLEVLTGELAGLNALVDAVNAELELRRRDVEPR